MFGSWDPKTTFPQPCSHLIFEAPRLVLVYSIQCCCAEGTLAMFRNVEVKPWQEPLRRKWSRLAARHDSGFIQFPCFGVKHGHLIPVQFDCKVLKDLAENPPQKKAKKKRQCNGALRMKRITS